MPASTKRVGGWQVIYLPRAAQVGPALKVELELAGFKKTGAEFQQHFSLMPTDAEASTKAELAARHICDLYNTGKKEYCKELLYRHAAT